MIVRFHSEANIELCEALAWYARQRIGLDAEFMRCVDDAIARIRRNPEIFPIPLRNARKALVKRFPYSIFFEANEREIMIFAVFRAKRNPATWKQRMK